MDEPNNIQPSAELAVAKSRKELSGPRVWIFIIITMILLAVAIIFLGQGQGQPTDSPEPSPTSSTTENPQYRTYTINYRSGVFSPTNLRIHAGDTVRFKNDGLISVRIVSDPHPEHNNIAGFDSVGDIPNGSFFSFTFAAKGTFGYHNERAVNETGAIIVR